jgi:hypothetical protein
MKATLKKDFSNLNAEVPGVEITLVTHNLERFGQNLPQTPGNPDRNFLQFLEANARPVPRSVYDLFLPSPFECIIHLSSYHSTI